MNRIILLGAAMGAFLSMTTAVPTLSAKPVRGCHPVNERREYGKPRKWIPLETLSQALASKRAKIDGYMLVIDGACIDALGDMSALKGIQLLGIRCFSSRNTMDRSLRSPSSPTCVSSTWWANFAT